MAIALDRGGRPDIAVRSGSGWLAAAGAAALGAGAVHAAAIGVHAENRPAALTFTVLAALQLLWGGLALVRSNRLVASIGALLGAGAVGGWIVAKAWGVGFIEGLDVAEPIQTADAVAAGLAAASCLFALAALRAAVAGRDGSIRVPMGFLAIATAVVTFAGMSSASSHVHEGGADHHGEAAAGHPHQVDPAVAAAVNRPYDPTKPIDLSGVPGVTPEQQAAAENIVAVTLLRLPKWSDPAVAEAAGFRSIGDGLTGVEHFVHQEFMTDDSMFDPDRPESLVYDVSTGKRVLAAAMFMTKPGTPLADVPNVGGNLMQWHVHDNLCYNAQGKVAGLTDAAGKCRPGLIKPVETPMIHVWIRSHRCGPFAALEGIGGGRIPEGEARLCDHVHGAPS